MEKPSFETIQYEVRDRRAYVMLARPDRLNAINTQLTLDLAAAVRAANDDPDVHVIILKGQGRAFCAGYDLKIFAEQGVQTQPPVWDPIEDYRITRAHMDGLFSAWRSYKPTIAQVHGYAVAGGSDLALSCDLIIMEETARIGYMPTRVWGCPSTAMWVYRIGAEKAKRMLLTGDTIDGRKAAEWGLVLEAVPADALEKTVETLADRIVGVPINQLIMQKMMINQAFENMGLESTQKIATLFDSITRHSPEGRWFQELSAKHGFHAAVAWRDSGRWIPNGGGPAPDELPEDIAAVIKARQSRST
jgi:enoyl-CoA hydratase/carnithine racemase